MEHILVDYPSIADIGRWFCDEASTLQYLNDYGILRTPQQCPFCIKNRIVLKKNPFIFRCKDCRKEWSSRSGTFFDGCHLDINIIMWIGYLWLGNVPNMTILVMFPGLSSATLVKWIEYWYELCAVQCTQLEEPIGGEGIIVEFDESKFGKRKFNRGHKVEGVWVVGGVERTPERKMFMIKVADRSEQTMDAIISTYVLPGSIVHTDLWKGYTENIFEQNGMEHATVNHSLHYKDPDTGVHTNTIEGTWGGVKQKIGKRHRTEKFIESRLIRFLWERNNKGQRWSMLLFDIKCTVYESEAHFV